MADTKISALTAASAAAAANELAINEAGVSKKLTAEQLRTFIGPTLISGADGTSNQNAAPSETWQILTANISNSATSAVNAMITRTLLNGGTYWYRYDIIAQSAATTTSHAFRVDFSGTVTKHLYHLFFPSAGVTAATGVVDQESDVTTGAIWAHQSTRVDATSLGPQTDVDTANADVHYVIEGILVCGSNGNLSLDWASEVAAQTTIMAGTMLQLKRLA